MTGISYSVIRFSATFFGNTSVKGCGLQQHGNLTASEESYDKDALTAAHRTLAFGTKVNVINLDNGKNVIVIINDRGPYSHDRLIDVSGAAARQLELVESGTARVKIEILE